MCGREERKYSVSTTTTSTEKTAFSTVWPKPRSPPNRSVTATPSAARRSVWARTASWRWNSSSSCTNHSAVITPSMMAGRSWTSCVDCSITVGTRRATNAPATAARPSAAVSTPTQRGAPQDSTRRTSGSRPRAMNRAAAIHTMRCPFVRSTETTPMARATPTASRKPVSTGDSRATAATAGSSAPSTGTDSGSTRSSSRKGRRRRRTEPRRGSRRRPAGVGPCDGGAAATPTGSTGMPATGGCSVPSGSAGARTSATPAASGPDAVSFSSTRSAYVRAPA